MTRAALLLLAVLPLGARAGDADARAALALAVARRQALADTPAAGPVGPPPGAGATVPPPVQAGPGVAPMAAPPVAAASEGGLPRSVGTPPARLWLVRDGSGGSWYEWRTEPALVMPSKGVTVPPPFRGGPVYQPGSHQCPACGRSQYRIAGPGPVPGTHRHRCDADGVEWFH